MKKLLLPALVVLIGFTPTFAQSFADGTNLVSLGFGLPPAQRIKDDFNKNYKNFIDYKLNNYGTILAKYEHGLHENFGLGLNLEYSGAAASFKYDDSNLFRYERKVRSSLYGFYLRINGHLPLGEKLDIYGGLGLGYTYSIKKYQDSNPDPDVNIQHTEKIFDFDQQATLGLRFMIRENMGIFGELGWATTYGQVGCTFKF